EAIKQRGETLEVLQELAREFFGNLKEEFVCLSLDLWAEATRSDTIKETLRRGSEGYRSSFAEIVRRSQAKGEINPDLEPDAIARTFCSLFQGFVLQRTVDPNFDVWAYVDACVAMVTGNFWIAPVAAKPDTVP